MARTSISFKEAAADIITLRAARQRLGRVQRAEVSTDIPVTPVSELGSRQLVGRIFDLPTISLTIGDITVGPRSYFLLADKDWANSPDGSFVGIEDLNGSVCMVIDFKSEKSDDIARSMFIKGARIERFSWNASAAGDFTSEFSLQGNDKRLLRYDVIVASGSAASNVYTHSQTMKQLSNEDYYLAVFASGVNTVGYMPDDSIAASSASAVTFVNGEVADGSHVVVVGHKDLSDQWNYTSEYADIASQPVGMRGYNVEVFVVKGNYTSPSFASQARILRAQTCTAQVSYPITRIQELGTEQYVGYQEGIPEVTGTIEILDHDWKLYEQLSGDDSSARDDYDSNMLSTGDWGLYVKLWERNADRTNDNPVMTIHVPYLDITGTSESNQVGQDSRTTFNWASRNSDMYIYKANKP